MAYNMPGDSHDERMRLQTIEFFLKCVPQKAGEGKSQPTCLAGCLGRHGGLERRTWFKEKYGNYSVQFFHDNDDVFEYSEETGMVVVREVPLKRHSKPVSYAPKISPDSNGHSFPPLLEPRALPHSLFAMLEETVTDFEDDPIEVRPPAPVVEKVTQPPPREDFEMKEPRLIGASVGIKEFKMLLAVYLTSKKAEIVADLVKICEQDDEEVKRKKA